MSSASHKSHCFCPIVTFTGPILLPSAPSQNHKGWVLVSPTGAETQAAEQRDNPFLYQPEIFPTLQLDWPCHI